MSIINLKYNLIFIHVPKTGGSSMESREFIGGGGHEAINSYKRFIQLQTRGINYNNLLKFAFVRNPYDRFTSAATSDYMLKTADHFHGKEYPITPEGFLQFILDEEENIRNDRWIHFVPQYKFLCIYGADDPNLGWKEGIEMNIIGKFENLIDHWKFICKQIGVTDELPHIRKNSFINYSSLWTPKAREIVSDIYKKDFEIFEYTR